MAKTTGLGDRFFLDGYDVSGDVGALSAVNQSRALIDTTGLDKFAHERLPGLGDSELSFNNYFNPADDSPGPQGIHDILKTLANNRYGLYFRGTSQGDRVAAIIAAHASYQLQRNNDGALLGTVQLMNAGGSLIEWGQALTAGKVTATGATQLSGVSDPRYPLGSDGKLSAYLQVFAFAGTDVTFALQHSDYSAHNLSADDDAVLLVTNLLNNHTYVPNGAGIGSDPRIITVTVVDTSASITAGTVRIIGTDAFGVSQQEDVDIAGGAGTYSTTNRFKTVTSVVTLNDVVTLGGSGDETVKVGIAIVSNSFSAITGGAFTQVTAAPGKRHIEADGPIKAFIRVVLTTSGGFSSATYAVAAKRYGPVTT